MSEFKRFMIETDIDQDEVRLVMEKELAFAYGTDSDKIDLDGVIAAVIKEADSTEDAIKLAKILTVENGDQTQYLELLDEAAVMIPILIEILKQIAIALGSTWAMDLIQWGGQQVYVMLLKNMEIRKLVRQWRKVKADNEYLKKMEDLIIKEIDRFGGKKVKSFIKGIF